MTSPASAITNIRNRPAYFLRWYQVTIAGNPNASMVYDYWIHTVAGIRNVRPGRILHFVNHNIRTYKIWSYDPGGDSFRFASHSVQMVNEGAVAVNAVNGYLLPQPSGVTIMVTGMLTGCSFCFLDTGAGIETAHIRPNPNNAANLRTNLINNGQFAGHAGAGMTVYGSHAGAGGAGYDHRTENVSVIGVFQGTWSIFAQVYDANKAVVRLDQIL
ncbi:MAG: hypothetical protein KC553_13195 [Nitrospina sp.]|nr:hypothetical protein [Nitrospina sp.]